MTDPVRQFGRQQDGQVYKDRPCVYAIAYDDNGKILVVQVRDKLLLPGGGMDKGETPEQALHREVLEETGWRIEILGLACRANEYRYSKRKARAANKQARFYRVRLQQQATPPSEDDHRPLWITRKRAKKKLRDEFYRWAVEQTGPLVNKLCGLDDIADGDSAAFVAELDGRKQGFIVVRQGETAYVYVNSCPHIGSPLDFTPGRFLTPDKDFILCSTHGALFRITDGHCVSGPCADQNLTAVSFALRDREIFLA